MRDLINKLNDIEQLDESVKFSKKMYDSVINNNDMHYGVEFEIYAPSSNTEVTSSDMVDMLNRGLKHNDIGQYFTEVGHEDNFVFYRFEFANEYIYKFNDQNNYLIKSSYGGFVDSLYDLTIDNTLSIEDLINILDDFKETDNINSLDDLSYDINEREFGDSKMSISILSSYDQNIKKCFEYIDELFEYGFNNGTISDIKDTLSDVDLDNIEITEQKIDPFLKNDYYEVECYEYNNSTAMLDVNEIENILSELNFDYDYVEKEHDNMREIVSNRIDNYDEFISYIQRFFSIMKKHSWYTNNKCGMHISISNQQLKQQPLNLLKLLVLCNLDGINSEEIFQIRDVMMTDNNNNYIDEMFDEVIQSIIQNNDKLNVKKLVTDLENKVNSKNDLFKDKHLMVNVRHYKKYDGRIELRYFGGENYEQRIDVIKRQLVQNVYILNAMYNNELDKEYKKALIKQFNKYCEREYKASISTIRHIIDIYNDYKDKIDHDELILKLEKQTSISKSSINHILDINKR